VVKQVRNERTDPEWPTAPEGESPVSELAASVQGAQSPFGDVTFPVPPEELPYVHPVTKINR
jgi:hypothetical protein